MLQEALRKLQKEITDSKGDDYTNLVGSFLMDHIRQNPHHAPLIVAEGKSVAGSLKAMQTEASKKKKGNFAMLTPDQGFAVVLKYYGISSKKSASEPAPAPQTLDISLDELMEDLM
ncbi:hypothetical protein [Paenibacillus antibioticophila]|uniref:hypothetical protein n=1 Tax=Paenibacillus antibioticophila TaxID=1274374 RepID=UPI0005CA70E4|nr:hypothetical protein [Paenibacillus antibioticophila]